MAHRWGALAIYRELRGRPVRHAGACVRLLRLGWRAAQWPVPGDPLAQGIASIGTGLRGSRGTRLSLPLDRGWVVDEGGARGFGGDRGTFQARGDRRLHAGSSYVF